MTPPPVPAEYGETSLLYSTIQIPYRALPECERLSEPKAKQPPEGETSARNGAQIALLPLPIYTVPPCIFPNISISIFTVLVCQKIGVIIVVVLVLIVDAIRFFAPTKKHSNSPVFLVGIREHNSYKKGV